MTKDEEIKLLRARLFNLEALVNILIYEVTVQEPNWHLRVMNHRHDWSAKRAEMSGDEI